MLTTEILRANEALAALSDEQLNTIATLSRNDEEAVIGKRFGEVYRQLDDTIAKTTGVARNGDEKTYLYLERAMKEREAAHATLAQQVADLTKDKTRLEKAVAEGAGEEAKKALSQAKKDLDGVLKQYTDLKAEYDALGAKHAAEIMGLRMDAELKTATGSLKFKKDLPQSVVDIVLRQTAEKVKGMNPEYIDDGQGGKRLVFKNESGEIMRNQENALQPFTATELIQKELASMGVLEEKRKAAGGGTEPPRGGGGGGTTLDLSGARTQSQANDIITDALLRQGLTIGSREFQDAMTKAWTDNNIKSLPLQ